MIEYTVNDTKPDLVLSLVADGEAVPLDDVLAVTLNVEKPSGATFQVAMTVDQAQSLVSATFASGQLSEEGTYYADVLIVRNDTSRQHALRRLPILVRAEYGELE